MERNPKARRWVAGGIALVMASVSVPVVPAQAGMVPTDRVVQSLEVRQDRDRVRQFLAREDVRRQMESWGVNPNEAAARVGGLTDAEIAAIAAEIDQLPAGQDAAVAIISAALAVFLILILTDLLGATDVFSFVDPVD